jgi:CRISPR/Cas system CMR-associated protein Cmr1 (group 7 of RAMP superfamily)
MVQIHAEYDPDNHQESSENYINSTYSLSESILRLDFINSNTYFMLHLSKIFKIGKFRIFTKKIGFFHYQNTRTFLLLYN